MDLISEKDGIFPLILCPNGFGTCRVNCHPELPSENNFSVTQIVEKDGLAQMGEEARDELVAVIRSVINDNDKALADYLAGKSSALKFLLGQVMRQTKGRADHAVVQSLLEAELGALE